MEVEEKQQQKICFITSRSHANCGKREVEILFQFYIQSLRPSCNNLPMKTSIPSHRFQFLVNCLATSVIIRT